MKINNMEPNIFVSYIKVEFRKSRFYTSKAFLNQQDAMEYGSRVVSGIDQKITTIEAKFKVLPLAIFAEITPIPGEPIMDVCVQKAIKLALDHHYLHR